jgi:hypothetical protein
MIADARARAFSEIATELLFDVVINLKPRLNMGAGPVGQRVLFGAAGGVFGGPSLRGDVLAEGGDWALFRPDGNMSLDVRLTLRTHDDALIYMTYGGRWITPPDLREDLAKVATRHTVDPGRYYFRTNPTFETGAEAYAWLNDIVCVGVGYLIEGGVAYAVFRVL